MSDACILYEVEILEARWIAELAATAREARSRILTPVVEAELGESSPARGEHHPVGSLAFTEGTAYQVLREAIEGLPVDLRRKLWALMHTGSGDYAKGDWAEALTAADNLSNGSLVSDLAEEIDLHDKLMKGLYAIGAAEPWRPSS